MYAGASGDFNPMHTNEVAAKSAGLPSVFGHGMFTMGLLGKAITDYVGVGNLERYQVRFTKQTWPGETLIARDRRQEVRRGRQAQGRARGEVVNQDGEPKVQGTAVAALPAAERPPIPLRPAVPPRFDLPTPDEDTQPFWDGANAHRLVIKHCNACGEYHHYPRPFCPKCWSRVSSGTRRRGAPRCTRGRSCT